MTQKRKQPFDTCNACNGSGKKTKYYYVKGKRVTETINCNTCGGTGRKKT